MLSLTSASSKVHSMPLNVVAELGDIPVAQRGYFTRAQATEVGIEDFELTRSVSYGFIERVGHGVYRVVGAGHDPHADLRIAWLRLDPAAPPQRRILKPEIWVSHESAAALHGFGVFLADTPTFITTQRLQPGNGVKVVRRSNGLPRSEWVVRDGFTVTSVERTAADLYASVTDGGHLGRFIIDATRAGSTDLDAISSALGIGRFEVDAMVDMALSVVTS